MCLRQRRSVVVPILAFVVLAMVQVHAAAILSPQNADTFAKKIELIRDQKSRTGTQRTQLTEDEVNSWFMYRGNEVLPTGVAKPQLTIIGGGQVSAQALVDLDAVAKRRARGGSSSFDPLSLIGGTVPVTVTGLLHTRNGQARLEVQSAAVSGVPVPVTVLQELVGYYSRTPERPEGVRLDQPFTLPSGIQQVEIGRGHAVVVQ